MTPTLNNLVLVLKIAIYQAGRRVKRSLLDTHAIQLKGAANLVTETDLAVEKIILKAIKKHFPDHGILTEESGQERSASPFQWIIDPIDGTTNFAHGFPHASVSIAVRKNETLLAGGVYDPFRDELFWAVKNRGTFLNKKRVRVSKTSKVSAALMVTGFPYDRQKRADYYVSFVAEFLRKTQGVRRLGSAALDMAYVACGRLDAYWEFNINPWDVAAGQILVEEAGGRVSDFRGRPYRLSNTSQTLCSNGILHRGLLSIFTKKLK